MTTTLRFYRPADAEPVTVSSRPSPAAPAPSLLARFMAWLHPKPAYKMAPELGPRAHYLGLHIGSASSTRSALR